MRCINNRDIDHFLPEYFGVTSMVNTEIITVLYKNVDMYFVMDMIMRLSNQCAFCELEDPTGEISLSTWQYTANQIAAFRWQSYHIGLYICIWRPLNTADSRYM